MTVYALRRLAFGLSLVWAASVVAFVVFCRSFDPLWTYALCRPGCDPARNAVIAKFHLDDSIVHRYLLWLTGLVHHGFGDSAVDGFAIGPQLLRSAGVTAQLLAAGFVLTLVFSVLLGAVAARRRGAVDGILRVLGYFTWSLPTFTMGLLLLRWLGPTHWFPAWYAGHGPVHWIRAMALPAATLSLGLIGLYSRYVRTSMRSELRQPYAVVARGKGLPESRVVYRHALRNSLVPFMSVLSLDLGAVVGSCLAAEYIFNMPGLAYFFLGGLQRADPFVLTAIVVAIAVLVAFFSLMTDLLVGWLDPRVAVGSRALR
ncbi:MAG TPA: ABC transporter permease [Gaiellaceae bacterium]|nr:ABC transporter permease [Gaiellaceae bacterium]